MVIVLFGRLKSLWMFNFWFMEGNIFQDNSIFCHSTIKTKYLPWLFKSTYLSRMQSIKQISCCNKMLKLLKPQEKVLFEGKDRCQTDILWHKISVCEVFNQPISRFDLTMKTSTDFVPVTHVECKEKVSEVKQKMQWMTSKLGLFFKKKILLSFKLWWQLCRFQWSAFQYGKAVRWAYEFVIQIQILWAKTF